MKSGGNKHQFFVAGLSNANNAFSWSWVNRSCTPLNQTEPVALSPGKVL